MDSEHEIDRDHGNHDGTRVSAGGNHLGTDDEPPCAAPVVFHRRDQRERIARRGQDLNRGRPAAIGAAHPIAAGKASPAVKLLNDSER
jgi:hypothetical protein